VDTLLFSNAQKTLSHKWREKPWPRFHLEEYEKNSQFLYPDLALFVLGGPTMYLRIATLR
jgi:hypothetical protein